MFAFPQNNAGKTPPPKVENSGNPGSSLTGEVNKSDTVASLGRIRPVDLRAKGVFATCGKRLVKSRVCYFAFLVLADHGMMGLKMMGSIHFLVANCWDMNLANLDFF